MNTRDKLKEIKKSLSLPIVAAPMFLVSSPSLVIQACKSGVIGSFPGPNARNIEELRHWFKKISENLSWNDAPWAFNMITHSSYGRFNQELSMVEEFKPKIVITALGGPHRVITQVHKYGGLVFADVNTPTYAKKALEKGADGLVLVCSGAGGHTGEYAVMPFIDEVRKFFDGPLIVGGGIGNGKAIRSIENLGVDFAYLGTRFLTTRETLISDAYRDMVFNSHMEDLVLSRAITGALGNWMIDSIKAAGLSPEETKNIAKIDFSGDMHSDTKAWKTVWSAGQGVGSITKNETVSDVVNSLKSEYKKAVFEQLSGSEYLEKF